MVISISSRSSSLCHQLHAVCLVQVIIIASSSSCTGWTVEEVGDDFQGVWK